MKVLPIEVVQNSYKQWSCELVLVDDDQHIYSKSLEGNSTIHFNNGNEYVGQIKAGLLNGKGIFTWENGLVYKGEFERNQMQGEGSLLWPDGSHYTGTMVNNTRHGVGRYYHKRDDSTYSGEWLNDTRTGKGRIEFSNGAVYEGEFVNGKKEGRGKITYPSGNYYEGQWLDNIKEGEGTMFWQTANEKYIGQWKNNKQEGRGTHVWVDSKFQNKLFRNRYEGEWTDCKREGFGTFFYTNGTRYDGFWSNNQRDGFGVMTDEYGATRMGNYSDDKLVKSIDLNFSMVSESLNFSLDVSIVASQAPLPKKTGSTKLKPLKPANRKLPDPRNSTIASGDPKLELTGIFNKNEIGQNVYIKMIDIEGLEVSQSFRNYLLRQHSQSIQFYKVLTLAQGEYHSAMTLEHFYKMVKDMRVGNELCNPAMINRLFSKGHRSGSDLQSTSGRLVAFLQGHKELQQARHVGGIEVDYHAQSLYDQEINPSIPLEVQNRPFDLENLSLLPPRDIHSGCSIVLFRHFINLLIITATLKHPNQTPQKAVSHLFSTVSALATTRAKDNNSNFLPNATSCQKLNFESTSFRSGVPLIKVSSEWTRVHNQRVFEAMTGGERSLQGVIDRSLHGIIDRSLHGIIDRSLHGIIDRTVTVRTLLKVFQRAEVIKEALEKLVFLEKVEKHLDCTHYYFRKEYKLRAQSIIWALEKSEILRPVLNHQLTSTEFYQLFELTMLKRLSHGIRDPEQLKLKYADKVTTILDLLLAEPTPTTITHFKRKSKPTPKDLFKQIRTREVEEERVRVVNERKRREEELKEQMENRIMGQHDYDIPSCAYLEEEDDEFD